MLSRILIFIQLARKTPASVKYLPATLAICHVLQSVGNCSNVLAVLISINMFVLIKDNRGFQLLRSIRSSMYQITTNK